jgi:hypothetical protein
MHGVEHHASAGRLLHRGHCLSLSGAFRGDHERISNTDMISMPEDRSAQAKVTYRFAVGCSPPTTLTSPYA